MKPKDPCPYCGRLYTSVTRAVPGKDPGTIVKVRDIEDHECSHYRTEPPLLPLDPSFQVIPSRSDEEMDVSLARYRRSIR